MATLVRFLVVIFLKYCVCSPLPTHQQKIFLKNTGGSKTVGHSVSYAPNKQWGKYELLTPDNGVLLVTYTADERGYRPTFRYLNNNEELHSALEELRPNYEELPDPPSLPDEYPPLSPKIAYNYQIRYPPKNDPSLKRNHKYPSLHQITDTSYKEPGLQNDEPFFQEYVYPETFDNSDPYLNTYSSGVTQSRYPIPRWDPKKLPTYTEPEVPYGYKLGSHVQVNHPIQYDKAIAYHEYQQSHATSTTHKPRLNTLYGNQVYFKTEQPRLVQQVFGNKPISKQGMHPSHNNEEPYFNISPEDTAGLVKDNIENVLFAEDLPGTPELVRENWSSNKTNATEQNTTMPELVGENWSSNKTNATELNTTIPEDIFSDDDGDIESIADEITTVNPGMEITTNPEQDITVTESPETTTFLVTDDYIDLDMMDDSVDGSILNMNNSNITMLPDLLRSLSTDAPAMDFFFEGNSTALNVDVTEIEVTTEAFLEATTDFPGELETIIPELTIEEEVARNITDIMNTLRELGLPKKAEDRIIKITGKKSLSQQFRLMSKVADYLANQDSITLETVLKQADGNDTLDPSGEVMMIIPTKGTKKFVALTVFPGQDLTSKTNESQIVIST